MQLTPMMKQYMDIKRITRTVFIFPSCDFMKCLMMP